MLRVEVGARALRVRSLSGEVLELELIQTHMAQKPVLRVEVGARALCGQCRERRHGRARVCKRLVLDETSLVDMLSSVIVQNQEE